MLKSKQNVEPFKMDTDLCMGQHLAVKNIFWWSLKNTGIPHIHIQIIFDKGAKSTNEERIVSATNDVGKNR